MRLAIRLMWAGAAISIVGIVVNFLGVDEVRREVVEVADSSVSSREIDRAVAMTLTVLGLFGVLTAALWLWMASANAEGRLWARRVATGFGLAYLGVAVARLGWGGGSFPYVALTLVTSVLAVSILVLLYRPESSSYYRAMSSQESRPIG